MRKDHQEILLVQRAHEPQKGFWDIPGGFCNPTEHPQETLHREVMEELGITVDIEKLWNVYAPIPYLYQNTIRYNCDVFYLATLRSGTPTPADDVAGFQWFALSDVPPRNLLAFESGKKALEELLSSNREGKI